MVSLTSSSSLSPSPPDSNGNNNIDNSFAGDEVQFDPTKSIPRGPLGTSLFPVIPNHLIPPPPVFDPQDPDMMGKKMSGMMEACFPKAIMSGVMGFALGGMFGMFMASMSYDTPFQPGNTTPVSSLPWRQQVKIGFRDMGARSWSSARNFGMVGALFSGIECGIEGLRAKNDLANGAAAGCLTGGILARNAGPQATLGGCAAFAAFSVAIDAYMRQPSDE